MCRISPDMVRRALSCIYEPEELAESELAQTLAAEGPGQNPLQRAQEVRGCLLDAVELLRLPARAGRSASASRAYDCMRLRYLSGFDVDSVAEQLAVGRRQVYRDLQGAEESVARVLSAGLKATDAVSVGEPGGSGDPLSAEIRALSGRSETVDLIEAVQSVLALVSPLAVDRGMVISLEAPQTGLAVLAAGAILRQVLTLLLSASIQLEPSRELVVKVEPQPRCVLIRLASPATRQGKRDDLIHAALEIARAQGWHCRIAEEPKRRELVLTVPMAKRHRVLIVEDNPGTQALYSRYLAESEWEPLAAPNPRVTVDMAAGRQVKAVVLDIMMSDSDGWSVLQCLKLAPQTQHLPVIVCSVLNDPDLAQALGASAYLVKPVSRSALLRTLRLVSQGASPPADEQANSGQDPGPALP